MKIQPSIYSDMRHDILVTTTSELTQVRVAGDLTVRNAKEIAAIFSGIEGADILIELQEPTALDLSFVQILISRIQALTQKGSHIRLHTNLREEDVKLLTNTGFSHLL